MSSQVQLVEVLKGLMALPPETQAALMQLINTPNLAAVPQMEDPASLQSVCLGVGSPTTMKQPPPPPPPAQESWGGSPVGYDSGKSSFSCTPHPKSPCGPQGLSPVSILPVGIPTAFDTPLASAGAGNLLSSLSLPESLLLEETFASSPSSDFPMLIRRNSSLHIAQDIANLAVATLESPKKQMTAKLTEKNSDKSQNKGTKTSKLINKTTFNKEQAQQSRPVSDGSILERFRRTKGDGFKMQDILGEVSRFSLDQAGSRFLQRNLSIASREIFDKVFEEAFVNIGPFMVDTYANYIVQMIMRHASPEQRNRVADVMKGHVLGLSMHVYGCRVVQAAIQHLNPSVAEILVREIDGSILRCANDINGNHVIQKAIEHIPHERIGFIIEPILASVHPMITHPYACRVLQAALEQPQNNLLKKPIIDLVMADLFVLAKHSYGNYVVQHAIKFACARQKTTLISCVSRHVSILGRDKFGSNVVETCIAYGATTDKAIMVESILGSGSNASDGSPPIDKLVSDPFGNYVIQKLMKAVDQNSLERIKSAAENAQGREFVQYVSAKFQAAPDQAQLLTCK